MSIIEFLEARIAEDEALATEAAAGHPKWEGHVMDSVAGRTVYDDQWTVATVTSYGHNRALSNKPGATGPAYRDTAGDATSLHIARHDPARVLAECAAKRAIIAEHGLGEVASLDRETWGRLTLICRTCAVGPRQVVAPCPTLRYLAAVYANHPDYDPEWAV